MAQLCRDAGKEIAYEVVKDYFCGIFFGENNDGLIAREKWVPRDGFFARLVAGIPYFSCNGWAQ